MLPVDSPSIGKILEKLVLKAQDAARSSLKYAHQLARKSSESYSPLVDPFLTDFGAHRWLNGNREESYSDWLAWILQEMNNLPAVLETFGLEGRIGPQSRYEVRREQTVQEGHRGRSGRIDLLIVYGPSRRKQAVPIEVKISEPPRNELAKHHGYRESLRGDYRIHGPILVSVNRSCHDPARFQVVTWSEVCCRLRSHVRAIRSRNLVLAGMILAFVGAVEQNLLGLSPVRESEIRPVGMPETCRHLRQIAPHARPHAQEDPSTMYFRRLHTLYLPAAQVLDAFAREVHESCRDLLIVRKDRIARAMGVRAGALKESDFRSTVRANEDSTPLNIRNLGAVVRVPRSGNEFYAHLWWDSRKSAGYNYPQGVQVMVRLAGPKRKERLISYLSLHGSQVYDWNSNAWAVFRWCELSNRGIRDYRDHLRKLIDSTIRVIERA